jgi:two-component system, OmpR family, response regulator
MELTGRIKVTGGGNLTAEIRGADLTAIPMAKGEAQNMRPPPPGLRGASASNMGARGGELRDNLPQLITAFYLSKETGELGVQRGKVKKVIYFEGGTPVFALSNLAQDRFGQFLVRVGKIQPGQLQDAVSVASATKRRTGDVLVERGLLKDTERLYYVGQQVKSIVYSLFGWEDGGYLMSFKDRARQESIKLDVHPANLIMRGIKKLYKPERLKRLVLPNDQPIPSMQPAYALNEVELERWEAELLPKIDGSRTCGELVALSQRPEHAVQAYLWGLMALSILEKRV